MRVLLGIALLLLAASCSVEAKKEHEFEKRDDVAVYVDKVVPFANPSESYRFYSLPFCSPPGEEGRKTISQSLSDFLQGSRKMPSLYKINFFGALLRSSLLW